MKAFSILIWLNLFVTSLYAQQIGGSWKEIDARLKSGDFSRLPKGTQKHGENYYAVVIQKTDWKEAKQWCEDRGGHLATITSSKENEFIIALAKHYLSNDYQQLFLGATDQKKEGLWTWVTGEKFEFTWWLDKNPDNFENKEHFLTMRPGKNGKWNDAPLAHGAIKGFIIEWEHSKLNPPAKKILSDALPAFPKKLISTHKLVQRKLDELNKEGTKDSFEKLIKSYGKKLVHEEKALTKQRKIEQAKAVQKVKHELIALLKPANKTNQAEKLTVTQDKVQPQQHKLVTNGDVKYNAVYERTEWKKRSTELVSNKDYAHIQFPDHIVGEGNFTLIAEVKLERIEGTWCKMYVGDTETGIDGKETKAFMEYGYFYRNEHQGERTAGVVNPGEFFQWKLERKDKELTIKVNDTILMKRNVSDQIMGRIILRSGNAKMTLRNLTFTGKLQKPFKTKSIIASHNKPAEHYSTGQVIKLKSKNRLGFYIGTWNNGVKRIYSRHSKDQGMSWDDHEIIENRIKNHGEVQSFSAVYEPSKRNCFLLYTRGNSNQKVYCRVGKSSGRMWSKPIEITNIVKDQGWDVHFLNSGIVTKYGKIKGRILIPYHAGGEEKNLYLLMSDTGKNWMQIGPILKNTKDTASITEFSDGSIKLAVGGQASLRITSSKDGGATWAKPQDLGIATAKHRGSLSVAKSTKGKELLFYAGSSHARGDQTNHLCLWVSNDKGKTWENLDNICYGPSYYANIISLEEGQLGLFVRSYNHWNRAQQRYHIIDLKKFGL